jgi:hypothetical protein
MMYLLGELVFYLLGLRMRRMLLGLRMRRMRQYMLIGMHCKSMRYMMSMREG